MINQKLGLGSYLQTYLRQGLSQLEKAKAASGAYPSSVLKTWQINMAAAKDELPAAAALLELSAFLAPDEIPTRILTAGSPHLGSGLGDYLRDNVDTKLLMTSNMKRC